MDDSIPSFAASVTDERVEEFKQAYQAAFGEEISDLNARCMLFDLLKMYRSLARVHAEGKAAEEE